VGSDREWHRDREFARESAVRVLRLYLHECVLKSGLGLGEELNAEWISGEHEEQGEALRVFGQTVTTKTKTLLV